MTSLDPHDVQVNQLFITMKKAHQQLERHKIGNQLSKMYQKNELYSDGILQRTYDFISDSNDKEDRKVGLLVLAKIGVKMQGIARSYFVNRFHSPVFKLFENGQDEYTLSLLQEAYITLLQVGANRNDSVIQQNLTTALSILSNNSKDIKKIAAYSVIKILVQQSPYITFKKLLQKQKSGKDNLDILISNAKNKNIKIREAYLDFLNVYIKYISQKKDSAFQKSTFLRIYDKNIIPKETSQEVNHLHIQTLVILLRHIKSIANNNTLQEIISYVLQKISLNKNQTVQKSLIKLIPLLLDNNGSPERFSKFLAYLRSVTGQDKLLSQIGINSILSKHASHQKNQKQLKDILTEVSNRFRSTLTGTFTSPQLIAQEIKTVKLLLHSNLLDKKELQLIASYAVLLAINDETLQLIQQISSHDIHGLSHTVQKQLIIAISKVLTGSRRQMIKQGSQIKDFSDLIANAMRFYPFLQSEQNKIKAVQALSVYGFRSQFRQIIGGFIKQKVLKSYLQWGTGKMRTAAVQASFSLCIIKHQLAIKTQILQILDKLIRIGLTDADEQVRQKVFSCLLQKITLNKSFSEYLNQMPILSMIFQATQDLNENICLISLRIICKLFRISSSAMVTPFLKKIAYNCFYNFAANFKFCDDRKHILKALSILIQMSPSIIQSHVNDLLALLLKYLDDQSNYEGLELVFFQMLYILTGSLPDSIIPYSKQISLHLFQALKDKLNAKKRNIAMKTFLAIIKQCGYVVLPYYQLPDLLQSFINLMKSQIGNQSRNYLMRIIGALGTLDRYKHQRVLQIMHQNSDQNQENNIEMLGVNNPISKSQFLKRKMNLIQISKKDDLSQELKNYYDELMILNSGVTAKMMVKNQEEDTIQYHKRQYQLKKQGPPQFIIDSITDFYSILLKNLLEILDNQSLSQKHQLAQDVLCQILQILGSELQPQINSLIPFLLYLSQQNQQIMTLLIKISQNCDFSHYIPQILEFVFKCKDLEIVVEILQILSFRFRNCFRRHLEIIIQKLYEIIQDKFIDVKIMVKIVLIYQNLRQLNEPYLSIILPQLMQKFMNKPSEVAGTIIQFLMIQAQYCISLIQQMPLIVNYFVKLLKLCGTKHQHCKPCVKKRIGNCVVLFILIFKELFIPYLPMIHRQIIHSEDPHELYLKTIKHMHKYGVSSLLETFSPQEVSLIMIEPMGPFKNKYTLPKYVKSGQGVQQFILQFDPDGKKMVDQDWIEWLKRTCILMLRKCPNTLLRACADLAQQYTQLCFELYNFAFFEFWNMLGDDQKMNIVTNIRKILTSNPKPYLLVRKTILQLAQFMHRKKCTFQLGNQLLADVAKDASAFAKHLYYRQLQFQINPEKNIQSLIQVCMKLGHTQNAFGLFQVANTMGIKCQIDWYQKINRFQEAYIAYQQLQEANQPRIKSKALNCLSHFNDQNFLEQVQQAAGKIVIDDKLAQLAVNSYAHLQQWQKVTQWYQKIEQDPTQDKKFWQAIINVKKQKYTQAMSCVALCRDGIYDQVSQLISFTASSQSFQKLLRLQQLVQIQQIVQVKRAQRLALKYPADFDKNFKKIQQKKIRIREIWSDRLIGLPKNQQVWGNLAYVRSLLFTKMQYFSFWYEYCQVCINDMKVQKCQRIINQLKAQTLRQQTAILNSLELLNIKLQFARGIVNIQGVQKIIQFLDKNTDTNAQKRGQLYYLCAEFLKIYHKGSRKGQLKIIELTQKASVLCNSQKQWHMLGLLHQQTYKLNKMEDQKHIILALQAFIKSLKCQQVENQYLLQGSLKILNILAKFSNLPTIKETINEQVQQIPIEAWINIIPQMMAQLLQQSNSQKNFINVLKDILIEIGSQHPQSLLYPLNFAVKSKISERVKPAREILDKISENHFQLTQQFQKISTQLGKAAFKLKQFWIQGIQNAWSIYDKTKNTNQVLSVLKQLCQDVMERTQSNSEIAFHQEFRLDIERGYAWLRRFQKNQDVASLSQAFQIFHKIYLKIKESFQNSKKVYLKNVAPNLVSSNDYLSSIPGLYKPKSPLIRIASFSNQLSVLQSKQRPRKLLIHGSDGKQYQFLLKGKEDLRLDERVMQFLGLVNQLLNLQREKFRKDLNIIRYSIIPLTMNTGLIGWVENCDTLNQLIKQYRTLNKIRVFVQKEIYDGICSDHGNLPMVNKLQIFKTGLQKTQGKDLLKILWLKSQNCETWIQRRTNYTTSLATMSMVGYIVGLGDRHPSNIMIQRDCGKIVHIDFGDCFEVASLRDKFPQKVPFRLTRMLQKAMGVSALYGLYQKTCQIVMQAMRNNKESLLSVLQTFTQDPIISWRIMGQNNNDMKKVQRQNSIQSEVGHIRPSRAVSSDDINVQVSPVKAKDNQIQDIVGSMIKQYENEAINEYYNREDIFELSIRLNFQDPRRAIHSYLNTQHQNAIQINQKAMNAFKRIKLKLKGTEFNQKQVLSVKQQVQRLIRQAISHENICQSWLGWCPFW